MSLPLAELNVIKRNTRENASSPGQTQVLGLAPIAEEYSVKGRNRIFSPGAD